LEVDETGELTKTYRQSDEWTEERSCEHMPAKRKLTPGPSNMFGDDDEAAPECPEEKQDRMPFTRTPHYESKQSKFPKSTSRSRSI
jgi:hypothetical protein